MHRKGSIRVIGFLWELRSVVGVSQQVVIIQGRKDNSVQYLKLKIAYLPWHER